MPFIINIENLENISHECLLEKFENAIINFDESTRDQAKKVIDKQGIVKALKECKKHYDVSLAIKNEMLRRMYLAPSEELPPEEIADEK